MIVKLPNWWRRKRAGLRGRADARLIPVAVGTVLIIGLIVVAATAIYLSRQAEVARAERELSRISLTLSEQTRQTIHLADQALGSVADRYSAAHLATAEEFRHFSVTEQMHTMLLDKVHDTPSLSAIAIVAADGYMVNFSRWWPVDPIRVDDRSYFKALHGSVTSGPFITEPVRNRGNDAWTIFLARRLNGPDGQFFGILLAAIETSSFENLYGKVVPGDQATISLFRNDGTLLARYPRVDSFIGRSFGSSPLFTRVMAGADHGVMHTDASAFDGLARIMTPRVVPDYPLIINVTNLTSAVLADWRRQSVMIGTLTAAAILLVVISGWLIVRSFGLQQKMARSQVERVRAEHAMIAAEMANTAKTRFLANMSHELRTPLNAVIGFAEMMRDAVVAPLDARYREYATDIVASGQHLLGVINDVLDIAKGDVGKLKLNEEIVDLAELIEECRRLFRLEAQSAGLTLETTVQPGLPPLIADPLRLKQVLLNLISNAVKFSSQGGFVSVTVAAGAGGGIEIAVADMGIGMTEEEAQRAQEPFQQIDNSLTRRYEGAGLGLPISKRLVELHGGTLTIKSAPAQGTTVTIGLPASRVASIGQPAIATM